MEKMVQEILKAKKIINPENFDNKIFMTGELMRDHCRKMKICFITGLCRLHEKVTGEDYIEKLATVAEWQEGNNFPELLLSVQALPLIQVNHETFIPLLQNDDSPLFDQGLWTLATGYLDQSSFTLSAIVKFLEKIRIICNEKHILPRHFCIDAEEIVKIFQQSWNLISHKHAYAHSTITDYEIMMIDLPELSQKESVQIMHNDMMSRADNGILLLDGLKNTIEMIVPLRLKLPKRPIIYDGENLGRQAELVPLSTLLEPGWLETHLATFTLHTLISRHADLLKQLLDG